MDEALKRFASKHLRNLHDISFRPTCFGASPRTPRWVPVHQVESKTERFAMAYRLLFAYVLVRPASEQNFSLTNRSLMTSHRFTPEQLAPAPRSSTTSGMYDSDVSL